MEQNEHQIDILIHQLLDIGEAMLLAGAEIDRVEDTLRRLGTAYGAERTNIFVITACIVITLGFADKPEMTQTRRIMGVGSTDFRKLEKLNALSRAVADDPIPAEQLRDRVQMIIREHPPTYKAYLGSVIAAAGFTLFFGGSGWDSLVAAAAAVLICLAQQYLMMNTSSRLFFNFGCCLGVGLLITALTRCFPVLHADLIMIGDIMLLIPGLLITSAARSIFLGDSISGIEKLMESLLLAASIAAGFVLAVWVMGGIG